MSGSACAPVAVSRALNPGEGQAAHAVPNLIQNHTNRISRYKPGVDNAWRESRGDIGKGMESVPSGGGSQDIIADHQGHQAIIEQRTQDSNIRNDVKHQVDNMVTEYKGNIGDTQNSIRGEENIVRGQYSELQNHHKTEALSQNNKYNEEKSAQERMPGADSPQELMKRAKEYQDKYKQ